MGLGKLVEDGDGRYIRGETPQSTRQMRVLKNWVVTLRSNRRQQIFRTVHSCVSAEAACKVATVLYRQIPGDGQNYWTATYAYAPHTAN